MDLICLHYSLFVAPPVRKAKHGSKRKKQKAGLNKSILSVGFGTNKMHLQD